MKRAVIGLLAAVLMTGCSGSAMPGPDRPGPGLAKADLARMATVPTDGEAAARATNSFGLALYGLVADDPDANVVLSPTSIALALAMARAGARGETAAEMDLVLGGFGSDEHAAWVAALDEALTSRSGTFPDLNGEDRAVALRIANAPFAQAGFELVPAYLEALATRFGAGLRLVDYRTAAEEARQVINAWVADQTEDRIEELLAAGTLDELTRLVLVNAIYLKAAWQTPFAEGMTSDGPFTLADGSVVQVPLMRGGFDVPYAAGAGWRAVELPYVGELAMLVIVPDDLAAFEAAFDEPELASIVASLEHRHVRLGLPKFGIESRLELADLLAALGMPTAFTANADFAGITTEDRLLIDRVIHQANIDVDEAGTEAAAATAIIMRATGMPVDDVELTVDQPFLFALRDTVTGAVVFLGRVADPSGAR